MTKYKFGKYIVETSNEEKIFFPENNIKKGDLIDYYKKISPIMIPHIKNRPLMMHRFPNGINEKSFYQKNASKYFPSWIKTKKVPLKSGDYNNYVICQNSATLVYLANQATITPHIWLSTINNLNNPDKLVFDLDPSEKNFKDIKNTALILKDLLEKSELIPFVMTTGSKGLHVVCPIKEDVDFEYSKNFAKICAEFLVKKYPEILTTEISKEKRGKKIFIDILRNHYGATSVAPYAIRARKKAPIATPLEWKDLENDNLTAQTYNIFNIFDLLKEKNDPWKNFKKQKKSLSRSLELLTKITK